MLILGPKTVSYHGITTGELRRRMKAFEALFGQPAKLHVQGEFTTTRGRKVRLWKPLEAELTRGGLRVANTRSGYSVLTLEGKEGQQVRLG